jgi:hypothetical protein
MTENNAELLNQASGKKIAKRLFFFMDSINLTPCCFERTCNISNGYLSKFLNNGSSIGSKILLRIKSKFPNLNLVWLLTGEGNMIE